jgi:hypothetical protein
MLVSAAYEDFDVCVDTEYRRLGWRQISISAIDNESLRRGGGRLADLYLKWLRQNAGDSPDLG